MESMKKITPDSLAGVKEADDTKDTNNTDCNCGFYMGAGNFADGPSCGFEEHTVTVNGRTWKTILGVVGKSEVPFKKENILRKRAGT